MAACTVLFTSLASRPPPSPPVAGLGLTLGASVIETVTVLDTPEAVGRFAQSQWDLSADVTAAGPLGKGETLSAGRAWVRRMAQRCAGQAGTRARRLWGASWRGPTACVAAAAPDARRPLHVPQWAATTT